MNITMTPEQWHQYFSQHPSPALEYIQNLSEALKAGFVDSFTAEIRAREIMVAMQDLNPQIDKAEKSREWAIREGYINQGK
jgi:hypothetical protein